MEAELQQKHREKVKVKKEIRSVDISLRTLLNVNINESFWLYFLLLKEYAQN